MKNNIIISNIMDLSILREEALYQPENFNAGNEEMKFFFSNGFVKLVLRLSWTKAE